jgi:hypothetical protein
MREAIIWATKKRMTRKKKREMKRDKYRDERNRNDAERRKYTYRNEERKMGRNAEK